MKENQFKKKLAVRSLLKTIKKEHRKSYMELPIIKWYAILSFCTIGCFCVSYYLSDFSSSLSWWASLSQSCGAGIFTGLIVFVLGNVHNQARSIMGQLSRQNI